MPPNGLEREEKIESAKEAENDGDEARGAMAPGLGRMGLPLSLSKSGSTAAVAYAIQTSRLASAPFGVPPAAAPKILNAVNVCG